MIKKEQLVMYAANHRGSLYSNLFMAVVFLAGKYKFYGVPKDTRTFMLEGVLLVFALAMFLRQRAIYNLVLTSRLKDSDCPGLVAQISMTKLLYILPWLYVLFSPLQSSYLFDHLVGFAFVFCVTATYGSASAPVPFLLFFDIALPASFSTGVTLLNWHTQETPYAGAAVLFFCFYVFTVGRKMLKSTLELIDSKHQMVQSARRADDANRAKSNFLALMSHEIRTPMTGIFGMLDFLKETPLNEEQKDFVLTISDCSKTLLNTLNDVLDFSKVESGKLNISAVNYDFHAMLEHAAKLLRSVAEDKGLKLNVFIAKDVPQRVRGDQHRIQQVVVNLINNAVKFTEKGEVTLRATYVAGKKPMLHVEVSDTGIGISPENQARLFSAFAQADDSISRKYGGTGLGLSIAKKLVELMGGKIGVASEEGKGSTFYFNIPHEQPLAGANDDETAQGGKNVPPQDILIAEDNAVSQRIIVKMLSKRGHRVTAVANGDAAIEAVKKQDFSLVFMDVNMPGRNGLDTTRAIHAMGGKYAKLPIIGLTANIMEDYVRRCIDAGMIAHVPKPFAPRDLYDAIAAVVTGEAALSAPQEQPQKTMRETLAMVRDGMGIDYMRQMVASNLKEAERLLGRVREEYAKENWRIMGDIAHDLKSVSGLIGMHALSAVAAEIESGCLDGKTEDMERLVARAELELKIEAEEATRLAKTMPDV